MITLASGVSYTDVQFIGLPGIIASVVLHGPGGAAIIDPGPTSTLPALGAGLAHAGIAMRDVRALLLTHIHLDHAGAAGTLVKRHPRICAYTSTRRAHPTSSIRPGCWRARRGCTATRWIACGATCCRCRLTR